MQIIRLATRFGVATLFIFIAACATPTAALKSEDAAVGDVTSPEAIVEAQLVAYNNRDLEGFLSFYSADAVLANYPHEITQSGKDQMRTRYSKAFANKNIRATIVKRIVFGSFVMDHERITAAPAAAVIEAVAIYEVKNGKIIRVTFLKP